MRGAIGPPSPRRPAEISDREGGKINERHVNIHSELAAKGSRAPDRPRRLLSFLCIHRSSTLLLAYTICEGGYAPHPSIHYRIVFRLLHTRFLGTHRITRTPRYFPVHTRPGAEGSRFDLGINKRTYTLLINRRA